MSGTGKFTAGTNYPGILLDLLAYQQSNTVPVPASKSIAVASTAVVYCQSFPLHRGMTFCWELQFTSSGTVAVTVELEQANQPPTTELTADTAFAIPLDKLGNYGMFPAGKCSAAATTYIVSYQPDATILGRLKLTGGASNDATTVLSLARLYQIKNT